MHVILIETDNGTFERDNSLFSFFIVWKRSSYKNRGAKQYEISLTSYFCEKRSSPTIILKSEPFIGSSKRKLQTLAVDSGQYCFELVTI